MGPPLNNPDDSVEEWDISDFISEMFTEDPQHASYDDNSEPSTQIAIPDTALWTPPSLLASNVTSRAESTQTSSGPIDVTANLVLPGSTATDFSIEPPTSGEASRSTQEVIQELPHEDEFFSWTDLDPARNPETCTEIVAQAGTNVDHLEQQAFSFNAAQDDTLGLFDPLAPSMLLETAGYPQTANTTSWESHPGDGVSLLSSMPLPEADLDRPHNPAWVPLLAHSESSFEAPMSTIPAGTVNPYTAEKMHHPSSVPLPPTQIAPNARNHQRHPLSQTPHGTYAPILPRESPSTNPSLAGNRQGPSSPSDASFKTAVVPQAQASAMRGQKRGNDVPASYLCEFDSSKSVGFGGDVRQLSKPQKRTRRDTGKVENSCLRCLLHKKKV